VFTWLNAAAFRRDKEGMLLKSKIFQSKFVFAKASISFGVLLMKILAAFHVNILIKCVHLHISIVIPYKAYPFKIYF